MIMRHTDLDRTSHHPSVQSRILVRLGTAFAICVMAHAETINIDFNTNVTDTVHAGADGIYSGTGTYWNSMYSTSSNNLTTQDGLPTSIGVTVFPPMFLSRYVAAFTNNLQDSGFTPSGAGLSLVITNIDATKLWDLAVYVSTNAKGVSVSVQDSYYVSKTNATMPTGHLPGNEDADYLLFTNIPHPVSGSGAIRIDLMSGARIGGLQLRLSEGPPPPGDWMADALEQPAGTFSYDPTTWFPASVSHDGVDAAEFLTDGYSLGYLSTTLPYDRATVSFWYRDTSLLNGFFPPIPMKFSHHDGICTATYSSEDWMYVEIPGVSGTISWGTEYGAMGGFIIDQLVITYPPPHMAVSPSITNIVIESSSGTNRSHIHIQNLGGSNIQYFVTSNVPWLVVAPATGTTFGASSSPVELRALLDGLSEGVHSALVSVLAPDVFGALTNVNYSITIQRPRSNAIDNLALSLTNAGNSSWFGQTNVSHDGQDAAQSGALLGNNQISTLKTTVAGPGNLSFWWRTSSETNADYLRLKIDGTNAVALSGESDWQYTTSWIPDGVHAIEWTYEKNASGSAGQDAGWIDEVVYTRQGPTLRCGPRAFSNATIVTRNAVEQQFTLFNAGTGTLNYTISSDSAWMTTTPTNGTLTTAPQTVHIVYDSQLLAPGCYDGALSVDGDGALDSPVQIPVRLCVNDATSLVFHVAASGSHQYPYNSWANAATNLQTAVVLAPAGCLVLVTNGIYSEVIAISSGVAVVSLNGPQVTEIRGGCASWGALVTLAAPSASIEGFTISNGSNGGVRVSSGATVRRCVVAHNSRAGSPGWTGSYGYQYCYPTSNPCGEATVICEMIGGYAGTPGGPAYGAGIYCSAGATIENCLVYSNRVMGGAVVAAGNGLPPAGGDARGGGIYAEGPITIRNSTIVDNTTIGGSGAPQGSAAGGGVYLPAGSQVFNSLIVNNSGGSESNYAGSAAFFMCWLSPIIQTNRGNQAGDPQFVNRPAGNYRLALTSPCRDVGSNETWMVGGLDLDGQPRISGPFVDIGAYEFMVQGVLDSDGDGIPDAWESDNNLNSSVSNAPTANADGDWMTDWEEYVADTKPTDTNSTFPPVILTNSALGTMAIVVDPTSTGRVYSLRWTTNLMDMPQVWMLYPPEQTGSGAAVTFTVTNDVPVRMYRTGVRLP